MKLVVNWKDVDSSFIDSIAWVSSDHPDNDGWCLINIRSTVYAYLVPSWAYGLLNSAMARGVSIGRVYSRVIRGAFPRVESTFTPAPFIETEKLLLEEN